MKPDNVNQRPDALPEHEFSLIPYEPIWMEPASAADNDENSFPQLDAQPSPTAPRFGQKPSALLNSALSANAGRKAWRKVSRNRGAAGSDGVTIETLSPHFSEAWKGLGEAIRNGSYLPTPLQPRDVPKRNGGTRRLRIPSVLDRTLHHSLVSALEPRFEPLFSSRSFAYRSGRSALDAVSQAQEEMVRGADWVLDLDIRSFFETVNHDKLLGLLEPYLSERDVLRLVHQIIATPDADGDGPQSRGIPQGSPLSPLLANIYLNPLDQYLEHRGTTFLRYADDIIVLIQDEATGKSLLEDIRAFLDANLGLSLHEEKTRIARPWELQFLGYSYQKCPKRGYRRELDSNTCQEFMERINQLTIFRPNHSWEAMLEELKTFLRCWLSYYGHAQESSRLDQLERYTMSRVRGFFWLRGGRGESRRAWLRAHGLSAEETDQLLPMYMSATEASHHPLIRKAVPDSFFQPWAAFAQRPKGAVEELVVKTLDKVVPHLERDDWRVRLYQLLKEGSFSMNLSLSWSPNSEG